MPKLVLQLDGQNRVFPLDSVLTIGRQSNNDLQLSEEKASRQHARVIPTGRGFLVEDLNSSNGTAVNGNRIARRLLKHGDRITIGATTILFLDELADSLEGDLIAGQYRLQKKIGQGGMGAVYKAVQISMDRTVAVKLLKPELTRNKEFVDSFIREARTAGKLNHPNIIHVHDFGQANGTYYISMEFIEGQDVQRILDKHRKFPPQKALHIVGRVAEALDYAHQNGIIHRDIKPQNIMLDKSGAVKLADLGLAKALSSERSRRGGVIMGTPHYMAPEVGKREAVDGRADIYSLGATFYHLITGRVPFDGPNSLSVITKHINQELPSPKQYDVTLPNSVCELVTRMMAKEPSKRPATAGELTAMIDAVASREGEALLRAARQKKTAAEVKRRPPARPRERQAKPPTSRLPVGVVTAIFVVLILIGAVAWTVIKAVTRDESGRTPGGSVGTAAGADTVGKRIDELLNQASKAEDGSRLHLALEVIREALAMAQGTRHASIVQARLERVEERYRSEAEREWKVIENIHRNQGAEPAQIARWTRKFLGRFPGTAREADAKALLRTLGTAVQEPPGASLPPTARQTSPRTPIPGPATIGTQGSRREEWARVRVQAARFRGERQFHRARRLLERFIRKYPGTPEADRAQEELAAMRTDAESLLSRLLADGEEYSGRQRYDLAANYYHQMINADGSGPYGVKAQEALERNDARARDVYQAADKSARARFALFRHPDARRELEVCLRTLVGTRWERPLVEQIEMLRLTEELFARVAKRSPEVRGRRRARVQVNDPKTGRKATAYVVRTSAEHVYLTRRDAEFRIDWRSFTDEQIHGILAHYAATARDHLGIGAFLLYRKRGDLAKADLQQALKDPALSETAVRYLARLDARLQLVRYDWSDWRHPQDWSLEDGDWNLRDGRLIQLDVAAEAVARHLKGPYKVAAGFHLSFDVTFLDGSGIFTAELEMDPANRVGVTFDTDEGFLAHGTVAGNPLNVPLKDLKPEKDRTYHIYLSVTTEKGRPPKLRCIVDDQPLPAVDFPGAAAIRGHVSIRTLGVAIALDNILIREGE